MDSLETLKNIIRNNKMSTRHEILVGIHAGIKKEFGDEAAENFVTMVENIKLLSATTFLQELYQLHDSGWKMKKKKKSKDAAGIAIPKDKNGDYDIGAGIFGVTEALLSNRSEEEQEVATDGIRFHFLKINGRKPQRRVTSDGIHYRYGYGY